MEDKKKYPVLDEEESLGMVCEPAANPVFAQSQNSGLSPEHPLNYGGYLSDDEDEFEHYKAELIAEAMNDGPGFTWNDVRQQIANRHPWLR